jgi:succinate-semialdehyde dehydrogenase/glutarate-semialdehyde dehydrogenase
VGVIAPWNYPLALAVSDSVPGILAGNAVVVKPDIQTTHTALAALELLVEAGLPAGVFQVVPGDGPGVGAGLVDRVDYVSFTGSTVTGRLVAQRAATRLIGCSLELGGKNPMIVREDADLMKAVDGAVRGSFANAGQLCISSERIYVQQRVREPFLRLFCIRTEALRLGAGLDYEADMGSLTYEHQLRKVEEHVGDAVEKGAVVQAGGNVRPDIGPLFFEPTVLTGVTPDMRLYSEETFGPVVSVYPFTSDDEAVSLANDSCYGLNASIWSGDVKTALRMAHRIETGTVNINESYSAAWASVDAPMGGRKDSGTGRRHGAEGLLKYTESQTVAVQKGVSLDVSAPWLRKRTARAAALAVLRRFRPGASRP